MYITKQLLSGLNTCVEQYKLFDATFPSGKVEISAESAEKARRAGLEIGWLAANPSTPPAALAALAALHDDASVAVRAGVARNPAAPAAVLAELAGDPYAGVRAEVARNPSAGAAVLAELAGDAFDGFRAARGRVARNPALAWGHLRRGPG